MDESLELFSFAWDNSIGADTEFIVAHNCWEALDKFKSMQRGDHYPFNIWMQRHPTGYSVLMTDGHGVTELHKVEDVISFAKSIKIVPFHIGKRDSMHLFNVDGRYGIVAHSRKELLKFYKSIATREEYLDLLLRLNDAEDYEPGVGLWVEEPVVMMPMDEVITIVGRNGSTSATVEHHIRQVVEKGLDHAHLLFVCGEHGILCEAPDAMVK